MRRCDLTGQRFNRLTVIYKNGKTKRGEVLWKCKCDCGNETNVITNKLKSGRTKSCGCLQKDLATQRIIEVGKNGKIHGMSNTRIYRIWRSMKGRCYNKNDMTHYPYYGGRGIEVYKEWKNDFINFYNWAMENGYTDELTIDRINVDGNYEPSNCRWVDMKTQANNKRNNRYIEYNDKIQTLAQWSEETGIHRETISTRLEKYGMNVEEALILSPYESLKRKEGI